MKNAYRIILLLATVILFSASAKGQVPSSADQLCLKSMDFKHKACKLKVRFMDLGYKNCDKITSWKWEFGDGTREFGRKVKHKFNFVGRYDVTLYYYDSSGEQLGKISKTINLDN